MPQHHPSKLTTFSQPSLIACTASCLVVGVYLGSVVPTSPGLSLLMLLIWLVVAAVFLRSSRQLTIVAAYIAVICVGACRWQVSQFKYEQNTIQHLAAAQQSVSLTAKIKSIPVVSVRPSTKYAPQMYGSSERTQFLADVTSVRIADQEYPARGLCQVYVEGNASSVITSGDTATMLGNLDWPAPPGNPGEFDYRSFLETRRISATVFVNHPKAIKVTKAAGVLNPGRLATWLRRSARSAITTSVDSDVVGVALALLLGNRHQLPTETEEAFIASGTMHLLAISGLHVGILCLFVMRIFNLLLIKRNTALILTAVICAMYAAMTDLRPSVLRATIFFAVFVTGQLCGRNQRPGNLISLTVILMLCIWPEWVFETGAWLSFLSVVALAWISSQLSTTDVEANEAPADSVSIYEVVQERLTATAQWLKVRYLQMICILAFTTPLVASTFNVISPIGLIINVLLIAVAAVILCCGFVTLFAGLLLPVAATLPGYMFSAMLRSVTWIVEATASVSAGHLYVPDFPAWFVPSYYLLLVLSLIVGHSGVRRTAICGLMCCIVIAFSQRQVTQNNDELRCTVLSVGHGSAAVVETPSGRVLLVDAGAMNRGSRAADIICGYLWSRGHRKIDGLLISHADMDHYNAVPDIMRRIPVAELLTSVEVVRSNSTSVQAVLEYCEHVDVPIRVLHHGDVATVEDARIQIRQLSASPEAEDNEQSLAVDIAFAGKRILLPGDLEGERSIPLLHDIGHVDLLVSPHHGSPAANLPDVAAATQPEYVVVSARDAARRPLLEETYASSRAVLFTSSTGAVTARLRAGAPVEVSTYLNR